MDNVVINRDLLPHNICFGCGHDNPDGLHIEIRRDADHKDRLLGFFTPGENHLGFPGIAHGGVLYSAMDCLAAWTPAVLHREVKALWVLRSASITYHKPARLNHPVTFSGRITEEGKPWEAVHVATEARDERGTLLAEGQFKVIPLPPERFKKISGVDELPENWAAFFAAQSPHR